MTDPAAEIRRMYLEHCEACRQAGIPVPTVDEWVETLDRHVRERIEDGEAGDERY